MTHCTARRLVAFACTLLVAPIAVAGGQSVGTDGYLRVDSSRIHYQECGAGPAIVLVHDGVLGAATWDDVWPGLCAKFHVLRYDRRGVGRSSPAKVWFSQTADLAALFADRRIESATVIGSSFGSSISIEFALEHPEEVQRLVLLGPVVLGMPYSDHFTKRDSANVDPLRHGDVRGAAMNEMNDRYNLAPDHAAARRKVFETIMANPQNLRVGIVDNRLDTNPDIPPAARLGEVRVPTLILVGEYDIPDVHAHAGAIQFGVWAARREVVRDAGHLIQLDQPTLLRDSIAAFIAETPTAAVSTERLQELTGQYAPFVGGQSGTFYVRDGRLWGHLDGQRDVPLYALSDSTFYLLFAEFRATFHRGSNGKATGADISIGGRAHRATRIGGLGSTAP